MSEQPSSNYDQSDYLPENVGTRFSDDGHEDRLDFHRHTVPKYDSAAVEAGRRVYESYETTVESSPVLIASRQLHVLHQARVARMRPEDTPFLKDAA